MEPSASPPLSLKRKISSSSPPPVSTATTSSTSTPTTSTTSTPSTKKPKPSSNPASPLLPPPTPPSLDDKPHSESNVAILQHQNRYMLFHIREKDRRLAESEQRERQWEQRLARRDQAVALLLQGWDEMMADVQLVQRRLGGDEAAEDGGMLVSTHRSGKRKRNAVLRLLVNSADSGGGVDDVEMSPQDEQTDDGDEVDDEQSELQRSVHARVAAMHTVVAALVDRIERDREQSRRYEAIVKEGVKEGDEAYVWVEKCEELERRLEAANRANSSVMRDGRERREECVRLRQQLVLEEERRLRAEDERERVETELRKAQRKLDKVEKDRETMLMKHKDAMASMVKREDGGGGVKKEETASSSSSTTLTAFDALTHSAASVEQLEQEKIELTEQLTAAQSKLTQRTTELTTLKAQLAKQQQELNKLHTEGLSEAAIKETKEYKMAQTEVARWRDERELLRVIVEKYSREMAEREAVWQREREEREKEKERMVKGWQEKDERAKSAMDETMRDKVTAQKERDELLIRLREQGDKGVEVRGKDEAERRRLLEEMERVIRQQEMEIRAMRDRMTSSERQDSRWILKAHKLQKQLDSLTQTNPLSPNSSTTTALTSRCRQLEEQLAAVASDPQLLATLSETNASLMSELDEIAQSHSEVERKLNEYVVALSEKERERSRLNDQRLKFETKETLLRGECNLMKQQVALTADERRKREEERRAWAEWKTEAEDLERRWNELKAALERRGQELSLALREVRAREKKLGEEREGLLRTNEKKTKLIDEREAELTELKAKYEKAKLLWNQCDAKVSKLEAERKDLKERLATARQVAAAVDEADMSPVEVEIRQLKRRLKCSVCNENDKEVVIGKCYHLFCHSCVDNNLKARHRKCPGCGVKFDQSDVHTVYGLQV